MNSRERVLLAINHQEADRAPIDVGATRQSGIAASVYHLLKRRLGLSTPTRVYDVYQMLAEIEQPILERFGADCVGLNRPSVAFGIRNEGWKPWTCQDGSPVEVPGGFDPRTDHLGNLVGSDFLTQELRPLRAAAVPGPGSRLLRLDLLKLLAKFLSRHVEFVERLVVILPHELAARLPFFHVRGELVVIDNDRPNAFVKFLDLKYDNEEYVGPGPLKSEAWGKWHNLFGDVTNGPLALKGTITGISNTFKQNTMDLIKTEFYRTGSKDNSRLEVDVPAFFSVLASDNTGGFTISEFSIKKEGALSGNEEFFVTGNEQKHLFRDPGKSVVRVVLEDTALGWPKVIAQPVTSAAKNFNRRELEFTLEVLATRLDVRILERQREGN